MCSQQRALEGRRADAQTPEMDPEDSSAHSSADGWEDWEEESAAEDWQQHQLEEHRQMVEAHRQRVEQQQRQEEQRQLERQSYRRATDALDVRRTVSLEEVKTFLLCQVRVRRRGSAFGRVPDAVCRLIVATAGGLFLAADAFKGRREGMVFKLGGRGLGYYPDYNALEQAARYRELTVGERLTAIETQLNVDTSWSEDNQLTAHEWEGVVSRLRELDSIATPYSELIGTRIPAHVLYLSRLDWEGTHAVAEVARALVMKWDTVDFYLSNA